MPTSAPSSIPGPSVAAAQTEPVADVRKGDPRTVVEMWKRRVTASPGAPAFRYHHEGSWKLLTWGECDKVAREIAAGLVARGVVPGDRVCLLSQTRLEWILADAAILLAGAVTVPIYASNTAEQCEFIIRDAGAKVVVVEDAAQLEKLSPLRDRLFTVTSVVHIAGDAKLEKADALGRKAVTLAEVTASKDTFLPSTIVAWEALRALGRTWLEAHPGELDSHAETAQPDSMFTIIYTSGTTGNPKGVVLTHENLTAGVCSVIRAITLIKQEEQFLFLPLAHVLARELEWATVALGFVTAVGRGVSSIKDDLVAVRPTFMAGVPRIYEKFYSAVQAGMKQGSPGRQRLVAWAVRVGGEWAKATREGRAPGGWLSFRRGIADRLVFSKLRARLGLDRCRFLISGGAPLAAEIAEFFHTTGLTILEGYGLTETVAASHVNRQVGFRFGTVGPAIDVVETKIADDGEILVRGPSIFRQYYNNPQATAESVEPDGWFHTGDIGHLEDGLLRITDRKKDLIVTAGGKKIAPQPLENALKARSPLVSQVLVYGDKRPYVVALVTLSDEAAKRFGNGHGDGGSPEMAALAVSADVRAALQKDFDALNATLASYETIKRFAILPLDFTEASGELTPSLKVKRKTVIERYHALIEDLYRGGAGAGAGGD
jgi:long-chain acyl-CoA synthetase